MRVVEFSIMRYLCLKWQKQSSRVNTFSNWNARRWWIKTPQQTTKPFDERMAEESRCSSDFGGRHSVTIFKFLSKSKYFFSSLSTRTELSFAKDFKSESFENENIIHREIKKRCNISYWLDARALPRKEESFHTERDVEGECSAVKRKRFIIHLKGDKKNKLVNE